MKYWILVKRNAKGEIISLYSPDFKELLNNTQDLAVELTPNIETEEETKHISEDFNTLPSPIEATVDFRNFTKRKLTFLTLHRDNPFFSPKKFHQLNNIELDLLEHWESFEIKIESKCKCCQKCLPRLGQIFNFMNYFSTGFLTYMALRIASNNSDPNQGSSKNSLALSIIGTIVGSTVSFLIYFASGTTGALTKIGENIDRLNIFRLLNCWKFTKENRKFALLSTLAIGTNFAAILITSVRFYQEMNLLTTRFLALDSTLTNDDVNLYHQLIEALAIYPYIISGAYTVAAFQTNFLMKFVKSHTDSSNISRIANSNRNSNQIMQPQSSHLLDNKQSRSEEFSATVNELDQNLKAIPHKPDSKDNSKSIHFSYKNTVEQPENPIRARRSSICTSCVIL